MNDKILVVRAVGNNGVPGSKDTVLEKVQSYFKNDPYVVTANIVCEGSPAKEDQKRKTGNSSDIPTWYSPDRNETLSFQRMLNVDVLPALYVFDPAQKILYSSVTASGDINSSHLIRMIENERMALNDGPYIMHDSAQLEIIESENNIIKDRRLALNADVEFKVSTDQYKIFFPVKLRKEHKPEPSIFPAAERMLVLSDIEGNFGALRELLLSNNVIDQNFNWIYGKGHLVIAGDVFDRGKQVTECLWLIYSLEEKARERGGYVHFVIGNHEIMNMNNNLKYVHKKYASRGKIKDYSYESLFGLNSELGRWLRTKNIMVKIGDKLFVHGGISEEINGLPLSIEEMNALVRKHLNRSIQQNDPDQPYLKILLDTKISPFWYRGYYAAEGKDKASAKIVDDSLAKFGVSKIITGHSIVKDVSAFYGGKVINVDTRHAKGDSEALLFEKEQWFMVDTTGKKKVPLLASLLPD